MATCPNCGVSTREKPGAMEINVSLDAEEMLESTDGPFHQALFAVSQRLKLACLYCDWSVRGHLEGDHFVADEKI